MRAWDGTPLGSPHVHRIADLHGGRLPDPIVGFQDVMTLQFVSDGTEDRWSHGDHFVARFDCTEANPNALSPSHSLRCTMEAHAASECGRCGGNPPSSCRGMLDMEADCACRHEGGHLVSIHSAEDQEHFESIVQAAGQNSVTIGLNDIDSGA